MALVMPKQEHDLAGCVKMVLEMKKQQWLHTDKTD